MDCRRCGGKGKLVTKTGKPDPSRSTHERYTGLWCYSSARCPVCHGYGIEKDKPNPVAGMRIHFNADGIPTKRERLDDDETERGARGQY